MACHDSPSDKMYTCAGYVAVNGYKNINVRLLASQGHIDINEIMKECENIPLYESFDKMLSDYENAQ